MKVIFGVNIYADVLGAIGNIQNSILYEFPRIVYGEGVIQQYAQKNNVNLVNRLPPFYRSGTVLCLGSQMVLRGW